MPLPVEVDHITDPQRKLSGFCLSPVRWEGMTLQSGPPSSLVPSVAAPVPVPIVHGPTGRGWSSWRERVQPRRGVLHVFRRAPVLMVIADVATLPFYIVAAPDMWKLLAGTWALTVAAFFLEGLHRSRLHVAILEDVPVLVRSCLLATLFVSFAVDQVRPHGSLQRFLLVCLAGAAVHVLTRALAYATIRWLRRTGRVQHRTLVLGSGTVAHKLVHLLDQDGRWGLHVLGYLDDGPEAHPDDTPGWNYLGRVEDAARVAARLDATVLLVGFGRYRDVSLTRLLRRADSRDLTILVVPRLFEIGKRRWTRDHIGAIPVIRPRLLRMSGRAWLAKRAFDVVLSGLALVALAPLMLIVAAAVRVEGGPGVIFRQTRVGRDGRLFEVMKFRSMKPADHREAAVNWSVAGDPRIGRVGAFIRRTSLDELPQLLNILKGDMTIVGPRPERPFFVQQFSATYPHYPYRHRVPVGLTGLAQVSGLRGDTAIDDRARFDNWYIENWSLWLDVKVMMRTLGEVVGARGR